VDEYGQVLGPAAGNYVDGGQDLYPAGYENLDEQGETAVETSSTTGSTGRSYYDYDYSRYDDSTYDSEYDRNPNNYDDDESTTTSDSSTTESSTTESLSTSVNVSENHPRRTHRRYDERQVGHCITIRQK